MKSIKVVAVALLATLGSFSIQAQASKTVVENAVGSKDHTTLVAAVKAAELVDVLSSKGPFTVFAPTNDAFAKLPKGTVEFLLKPENKAALQGILTYHVVAGNLDSKAVVEAITKGKGSVTLTTVQGGKLVASLSGKNVILTDEKGNKSTITAVDITSSNGVIHVIDTVVMPKS
ncbi:fasciclin domain-containing protein [Flavobacterium sp. j3]|uniref:Fasciclin domain-containing protein n=1 Tax=Flavobacterium aureirubrum TaxID=3133147 RepID=A0ABU9N699_9FLAO